GAGQDTGEGVVEVVSDLARHFAKGAQALRLDGLVVGGDQPIEQRANLAERRPAAGLRGLRCVGLGTHRIRTGAIAARERTGSTWTGPETCERPGSRGPSSHPAASRRSRRLRP